MRKRVLIGAAVLVAMLVAGGVSFATLREADHGLFQKKVFTAVDITVNEDFVDVAPAATGEFDVSTGDTFFFHDELWNRARTTKLGTIDGNCEFQIIVPATEAAPAAHCVATAFLRGGTVELAGGVIFTEEDRPFFVAVTGGTERYENVVGEVKITSVPNAGEQEVSLARFELVPSFSRNP